MFFIIEDDSSSGIPVADAELEKFTIWSQLLLENNKSHLKKEITVLP